MRASGIGRLAVAIGIAFGLAACGGSGGGDWSGGGGLVRMLTTSLPTGTSGVALSTTLEAAFPHPPGAFIITSGTLPPGLTLDRRSGEITGYPRLVGIFRFEVAARDGIDRDLPPGRDVNFSEDRQTFSMRIDRGPPHILPQALPDAQYRTAYSYFIDVAGGTLPYHFEVTGPPLPTGLSLDPDTGNICCFPLQVNPAPGNPPFFVSVTVRDATGLTDTEDFTLRVVVQPLGILTTSPLQGAAKDFPYDVTLALSSPGAGSPYTWVQKMPLAPGETDLATINMEVTTDGHVRNRIPPGPSANSPPGSPYLFTVKVTDESGQAVDRQYALTVSPGPVVYSITPNRSVTPGPYLVDGINFQPGASVIFKPGATQSAAGSVSFVNSSRLSFPTAPPAPGGQGGYVTLRVLNPDGGFFDLPTAFAFPAASLTFSTTSVFPSPNSTLSSTGIDVADVDKDGFADIVHSGSSASGWGNANGSSGGVHVLVNAPPGGTFTTPNPSFNQVVLAATGDWHMVKFVDMNTDGWPDVVAVGTVSGQRVARTWLNSSGTFNPATFSNTVLAYQGDPNSWNTQKISDIAFGRFTTGDNVPDLAYVFQDNFGQTLVKGSTSYYGGYYYQYVDYGGAVATTAGNISGAFGTANLALARQTIRDLMNSASVGTGDFNNDGRSDVVVGDQAVGVFTFISGAAGSQSNVAYVANTTSFSTFGSWSPLNHAAGSITGAECLGVAVGDITGDGRSDVVIAANAHTNPYGWFNDSPGMVTFAGTVSGFTEQTMLNPGNRPRYCAVFDADFDLSLDVVATGGAAPSTFNKVMFMKGPLTGASPLKQTVTVSGSPNLGRVAAGDFNRDGRPDVAAALSFFADEENRLNFGYSTTYLYRGAGNPLGVVILLNTSQ